MNNATFYQWIIWRWQLHRFWVLWILSSKTINRLRPLEKHDHLTSVWEATNGWKIKTHFGTVTMFHHRSLLRTITHLGREDRALPEHWTPPPPPLRPPQTHHHRQYAGGNTRMARLGGKMTPRKTGTKGSVTGWVGGSSRACKPARERGYEGCRRSRSPASSIAHFASPISEPAPAAFSPLILHSGCYCCSPSPSLFEVLIPLPPLCSDSS